MSWRCSPPSRSSCSTTRAGKQQEGPPMKNACVEKRKRGLDLGRSRWGRTLARHLLCGMEGNETQRETNRQMGIVVWVDGVRWDAMELSIFIDRRSRATEELGEMRWPPTPTTTGRQSSQKKKILVDRGAYCFVVYILSKHTNKWWMPNRGAYLVLLLFTPTTHFPILLLFIYVGVYIMANWLAVLLLLPPKKKN